MERSTITLTSLLPRVARQRDAFYERLLDDAKGERAETPFPTIDIVAALYDEFLQTLNGREHSGEGMQKITPTGRGWMSPNECWDKLIGQVERFAKEILPVLRAEG